VDRLLEGEEGPSAGVRLVALHHRRPLVRREGAGTRVGEEVDQDIRRVEQERVVVRPTEGELPFLSRGLPNGLDRADAEGLDDGVGQHVASIPEGARRVIGASPTPESGFSP
jgi:hypothetical protein